MKSSDNFTMWLVFAVLVAVAFPAAACLWDNDTLRAEAKGLPGMAEIITGRFERNPPLYFQMRLERSERDIAADARNWNAYDNAGVSCDRLGKHTEAIEWMNRKRGAMEAAAEGDAATAEHRYRYLANLATFHAHRWFASGANRADTTDLERGIELIEDAIELNPDAHFGRERYQLMAMRWVLNPPGDQNGLTELPTLFWANEKYAELQNNRGSHTANNLRDAGLGDAVQGLGGLIALGNAWESLDVFFALAFALNDNRNTALAHLAKLRCIELIRNGKKSNHPSSPSGEDLVKLIEYYGYQSRDEADVGAYFPKARANADEWHKAREKFMLSRLQAGRHPDTDSTFWDGYVEVEAITIPNGILGYSRHAVYESAPLVFAAAVVAIVGILLIRLMRRLRLRREARAMTQS